MGNHPTYHERLNLYCSHIRSQGYVERTPREFQPSHRFVALDDDDDPSRVS